MSLVSDIAELYHNSSYDGWFEFIHLMGLWAGELKEQGKDYNDDIRFNLVQSLQSWARTEFKLLASQLDGMEDQHQGLSSRLEQVECQLTEILRLLQSTPLIINIETPRHHGYVYVVQAENGLYKIGKSKDPTSRIKAIGVRLPYELEVVLLLESGNYTQLERNLHRRFADKRKGGEWFELSEDDLDYIKSLNNEGEEGARD